MNCATHRCCCGLIGLPVFVRTQYTMGAEFRDSGVFMKYRWATFGLLFSLATMLLPNLLAAATIAPPKKPHSKSSHVTESASTQKKIARSKHSTRSSAKTISYTKVTRTGKKGKKHYYERFSGNSFASDQADGDVT